MDKKEKKEKVFSIKDELLKTETEDTGGHPDPDKEEK